MRLPAASPLVLVGEGAPEAVTVELETRGLSRDPLALRSRRLLAIPPAAIPSPTTDPIIDVLRGCVAVVVPVELPAVATGAVLAARAFASWDAATVGAPWTRSHFSTKPALRTQALLRVYLPNPPFGPIFSKWLSPYCQPSSSTPGQFAQVAASPSAGPNGISCPEPTGSGAAGSVDDGTPFGPAEEGAAAAGMGVDGLSPLERATDDANVDSDVTDANGDLDATLGAGGGVSVAAEAFGDSVIDAALLSTPSFEVDLTSGGGG